MIDYLRQLAEIAWFMMWPLGFLSVAITGTGIILLAEFTPLIPGEKPSESVSRWLDLLLDRDLCICEHPVSYHNPRECTKCSCTYPRRIYHKE